MAEERRTTLIEAVARALELPEPERGAYLAGALGDDAALLTEARSLVDAALGAGGFLSDPTRAGGGGKGENGGQGAGGPPGEGAGSVIGRYKLLEQIGEGGFGAVFMAEQREPVVRRVALKIIKLGMDTRAVVARFEAERQALAMMDHPNIARVLDGGATPAGRPFFVMELVRGEPIDTYCDRMRLSTQERLDLFAQVCHAVQHAHSKGIIHRDIKPGNVLVSLVDGRPVPKVIDFGIAKATSARLTEKTLFTEFRQMIGTPAYMSPEQAGSAAGDVDTRTDVYSLGVLLYELLTGSTPFDATRLRSAAWGEMQRIIREDEPQRPSTRLSTMKDRLPSVAAQRRTEPARLRALVRGDLDWIVMRCLEKDRARRYPTADALAEDVRRHIRGEAVEAAPPSSAYRARKFVRRHRAGLAALGCIALALVAGLTATAYGLVRAVKAERLAIERLEQTEKARAEAVTAKENAEKANRMANSVTEFFTQDLLDLRPRPAGAPEVTVRELLDAVPAKIDRYFKSEPAVEGIVRERVGQLYRRMGELKRSAEYLSAAIPLLEQGLGPENRQTLGAIQRLGELKMDVADWAGAAEQFERAYRGRLKAFGIEYSLTRNSLARLGVARVSAGQVDQGLADLRAAVEGCEKIDGRESRTYVAVAQDLALALAQAGRHGESIALGTELLETIRRRGGNLGPLEPQVREGLCKSLLASGQPGAALEHAEAVIKAYGAVYAPTHPVMVDARLLRGQSLAAVERNEEAASELEAVYKDAVAIYGAAGGDAVTAAAALARLAEKAGDAEGAAQWRGRADPGRKGP